MTNRQAHKNREEAITMLRGTFGPASDSVYDNYYDETWGADVDDTYGDQADEQIDWYVHQQELTARNPLDPENSRL